MTSTRIIVLLLMTLIVITFVDCNRLGHRIYFVSHSGNDRWSGQRPEPNSTQTDGPFASLEQARDAIRDLKKRGVLPAGGVVVNIREGEYQITQTFLLEQQDGGTERSPVVYQAYKNENVRFIGGELISGFEPVEDKTKSRLAASCRDQVLQIDLTRLGIRNYGELTPRGFGRAIQPAALELFFNNRPMQLARWPNQGWVTIADVPDGKDAGKFTYDGDRPLRWRQAQDIWVHGYWTWDWADSYEKIKSINVAKKEIATHKPHGIYGYTAGKRYYVLNLLEELDQAGEWYLDHDSGLLYFWPPSPVDQGRAYVSMLQGPIFALHDVSYVTIQGFDFACTRGSAVEIHSGSHTLVSGCTFRNIGNLAVIIDGGIYNGVKSCEISETGDGGIILSGGDRLALTPGNNFAVANHIHHYSRWCRTYRPAVRISGVGNRIAHNLIHDAPHNAIQLSGNEHLIEFNEIHHVCEETGDVGAFYMGRDWTERGNIVRYNYFHDIYGPYTHGAMAVYLDDWASGTTVFGNVFYKASRAVFIGGGRDNIIENNIFIECTPAVHLDARGLGWASYYFDGSNTTLTDRLDAMNYRQPPYSVRYPQLLTLYDDDPAVPENNSLRRNICYGGQWLEFHNGMDESVLIMENNFVHGDPGFVDVGKLNFKLKDDSPVYKLGFQRIPMEEIGLDHE